LRYRIGMMSRRRVKHVGSIASRIDRHVSVEDVVEHVIYGVRITYESKWETEEPSADAVSQLNEENFFTADSPTFR
jgi:ppGpp synthetase/RelA/SpoT-type nucleotidyltranferase